MAPEAAQALGSQLGLLLTLAWLLPLAGFLIEIFGGYWSNRTSKTAAYIAVGCIVGSFVLSMIALISWGGSTGWAALKPSHHGHHDSHGGEAGHASIAWDDPPAGAENPGAEHAGEKQKGAEIEGGHQAGDKAPDARHANDGHGQAHGHGRHDPHDPAGHDDAHAPSYPKYFSGELYTLAEFGGIRIALNWYVDSLTLVMFVMVTFIASCIHIYAVGYMSDELTEHYEDHQVHSAHGHFHRPGRFHRFFAFLSLFSFSMLGLVLAGNIFQVFVFWELVGICSYFLIGFYVERQTASTAANKAFIMNRVGDFGFLIGLMILLTHFNTFDFGTTKHLGVTRTGIFDMVRGADGVMTIEKAADGGNQVVLTDSTDHPLVNSNGEKRTISYFLLIAAGLGVFAGCIGKSAQFPLQTWLPDAMEGPTPVSALVHSATMVAAGVYLAGRFYPVFTPEVLLVIAYVGAITLFLAATIAVVATDIKRVLAYSTISQLGYMMLGLGVGGWGAGLFHLITHAFFKSLMFLASGSVIHGCHHVQEMTQMGGLRRKMPITAYTMLVGVIAIAGLAIPISIAGAKFAIAFSGYHSKDAIIATAMTFGQLNTPHLILFLAPLLGAGITAFYMFRLWFYTFAGEPRDKEVYDHAHESPWVMCGPLVVLSALAAFCAVGGEEGVLYRLIAASEPAGVGHLKTPSIQSGVVLPTHDGIHENHATAGMLALLVAAIGAFVAYVLYGARWANPADIQRQFPGVYSFLLNKWQFDELYDVLFTRPAHVVGAWFAAFDRVVLDGFLHGAARTTVDVSTLDRKFDETIVDGLVNAVASVTASIGEDFRALQTGRLRQYVMFLVVGVVGVFVFYLVNLIAA
jgi:NADH-quinone oxidoreductase subunit L